MSGLPGFCSVRSFSRRGLCRNGDWRPGQRGIVAVGAVLSVTVSGTNPCGAAHINYGDGTAITYAITGLPVTQTHTYDKPGTYAIVPRRMGNCDGEATIDIAGHGTCAITVASATAISRNSTARCRCATTSTTRPGPTASRPSPPVRARAVRAATSMCDDAGAARARLTGRCSARCRRPARRSGARDRIRSFRTPATAGRRPGACRQPSCR